MFFKPKQLVKNSSKNFMKGVSLILIGATTLSFFISFAGCNRILTKKLESPFTTDYEINKDNIDFFLNNDVLETAITGGPFYNGAQKLPSQKTEDFDQARQKKIEEIKKEAVSLVKACNDSKTALANLRSEYIAYLNEVYKEEPGLKDIALETLNAVALNATNELFIEEQYKSLSSQKTDQLYAQSFLDYLSVSKAVELAGAYLEDADTVLSYSALMIKHLSASKIQKVKSATESYDAKMEELTKQTQKSLEPVVQHLANVELGFKQLSSADYYFSLEAIGWMKNEQKNIDSLVKNLEPREGLSKEDIENIKIYYQAFKELNSSIESHLAALDKKDLVEVSRVPFPSYGPSDAWAAEEYKPGENYQAGNEVLKQSLEAKAPNEGWFSKGWSAVKSGFGKLKTGVGVGIDVLNLGVKNISSVGAGIYYGNSAKDIIQSIGENVKEFKNNYENGVSGAETFQTAYEYIKGVEKGAGKAAGSATQWAFEKIFGKGKIASTAGWAMGGITKISVGMFTGLAKGIYKVANKNSSTEDVTMGFIEIGLSCIGNSKIIIRASQLPGLLKGGAEGAKTFAQIAGNLVKSVANASERKALKKAIADLLKNKLLTPDKVTQLINNSIQLEAKEALKQALKNGRQALISQIKDLLSKGAGASWSNFKETIKGSLQNLFVKSFPKTWKGVLEALTTKMGTDPAKYLDNLFASGFTNQILKDLIKEALAIPPDPAQVNGVWKGSILIAKVDIPKSEQKRAEEAGCEQAFKQLEGKNNPITMEIKLNSAGSGTVKLTGRDTAKGSATYSDGFIKMVVKTEGAVLTFNGKVAFKKEGGMTMSGTWRAPYQNSKIIMSGTFSVAK